MLSPVENLRGGEERARGRDQHSRPPVPVLPTPPTPPCLSVVLSYLSVKRGCPPSGMCPETTKMAIEPHLAEAAASGSASWYPTQPPPHFRDGGFLCTYLGIFTGSEPHTGNARLRPSMITSARYKWMEAGLMGKGMVTHSTTFPDAGLGQLAM